MQFSDPRTIRRVAVIGAGTIGASWAAHFLARGMEVRAWDPAAGGEARARARIDLAWPVLQRIGLAPGASRERLSWHHELAGALDGVEFVQESAPENRALKAALYRDLDDALAPDVVMCSSTSGLLMSDLQAGRRSRARLVVGHPFNPPHLIPLVEVLGGRDTAPEAVDWAMAFYDAQGKQAIRLNKEVPGHLVNRLQAALWREAMDAVLSGLASVRDVDAAIAYGPGLRWGVMGPFALCSLAGGPGGFANFLDHFGAELEAWWRDMRDVRLSPEACAELTRAVGEAFADRSVDELAEERDALLLETMGALARARRARESR